MLAVPLLLAAGGSYFWLTGGRYQETENANLRQARVTIASEAAGRIVEVDVADNAPVKAGDTLFVVDPEPYRIALSQADAALAAARLNVEQLRAAYGQAVAQERVAARRGDLSQVAVRSRRRSRQEGHQRAVVAGRSAARSRSAPKSSTGPPCRASRAPARRSAAIPISRPTSTRACSPRSPRATRPPSTWRRRPCARRPTASISQASSFKVGQYVAEGTSLFSLVETGDTWVEANFKETQLTHMKPGQTAEVTSTLIPM